MENEDYRIVELHGNKLKVYRDGRIEREFVYKRGSRNGIYKKGDIKLNDIVRLNKSTGYMICYLYNESIRKVYYIHRIIAYTFLGLDIDNPKKVVDHIDRNKLNNNVVNLRIVTQQQNTFNTNSKGWCLHKKKNRYEASITVSGKRIYLGKYKTEACARYSYLTAKNHYHQF